MRALVTGSAGFVGRHMVRALVERGYRVVGSDLAYVSGFPGVNSGLSTYFGDCRRWFDLNDSAHFDLVVHCAAVVGGRTMIDGQPLLLACEDLSIDASLFRWALRARPGRIVYFSSSAAYPVWRQQNDVMRRRLGESMIQLTNLKQPDQTYGLVKLTGERLAAEANVEGIPTHVFRPFSGYGADQDETYPFPAFVRRAIERQSSFHVWGSGDSARDWVHISDVVGAVLAAIDQDVLGPVNICTGRATTFDDLAAMCMDAAGHQATVEYVTDAPQGVFWRVGDPTRMLEFYEPKVSLEEGIARAVAERVAA